MKDCYYSRYEPIFGAWHITDELGAGAEGHLYRIRRMDSLGNEFYSALKAVHIPGNGEAELESMLAGGMTREEALNYYKEVLDRTVQEFGMLEILKGNSNIVSYEDHEIFKREGDFGWDILIRLEELTPLVRQSVQNPLDETEIIKMGADICRGLVLCRKYGIVHRDIKPENIFISPSGSYKLGDFGIARVIGDTSTSFSRKGTYSYMAPEIYWGREYDHTVDQYSLGIVMYKYLNDGRLPFMPQYPAPIGYRDGETAFSKRINMYTLPPPRNGSDALKKIVLKACSYKASERYPSAAEMLADLESLLLEKNSTSESGRDTAEGSSCRCNMRLVLISSLACLMLSAAVCCSIPKDVTDITVTGLENGGKIYIGDSVTPEYTVVPVWFKDAKVSFTSDNEDIVTVDEEGRIEGTGTGTAVLNLRAKGYSEKLRITVLPKVQDIRGIQKNIILTTGSAIRLDPVLIPKKFALEKITYSTDNEEVAVVSNNGELIAASAGETVLRINAGGCTAEARVKVTDPAA